jgi:hypothetical protein
MFHIFFGANRQAAAAANRLRFNAALWFRRMRPRGR